MKQRTIIQAIPRRIAIAAGICLLAAGTAAQAQTTVFFDDFENGVNDATLDDTTGAYSQTPDVDAAQSDGNTSGASNSTLWVKSNQGYGATRQGLVDETGLDFTDPVGEQAWAFRYTNSGLTTADGVIGALAPGATYTVTFDVVEDGHNSTTPFSVKLVTFNGGARNDTRDDNDVTKVLTTDTGNAPAGGAYQTESFSYTVDLGTDASVLGHDVAVRFRGATSSAIIDNVKVEVAISGVAHWDINGSSTGAGGASPAGTWDAATTNWNPDPVGEGTVAAWTPGINAIFAAGTDATGAYSVTVNGSQDIGGLLVEEGLVSLDDGTSGGLNMTASSTVLVAAGSDLNVNVPLTDATGAEVLTKAGSGLLSLGADNSGATGGMALNGGVTRFDDSLTSINGTGANVLINGGGIASFGGTFLATDIPAALLRIDTASTGTIAPDGYEATNFDFDTPGLASAYFGPIGTVNYTGTLTPAGTTYRLLGSGGTLTLNSALTATNTLDVKGPGTLQFNGFDATMGDLTSTGSPVLQNGSATTDMTLSVDLSSSDRTYAGTLQDGGAATLGLTKNGTRQLTLTTNNAFTGNLTINGGTVQLGTNGNTGSLNGGTYPGDISIASGSTFRDRSNNTVTMSGVISGDGNLHQDGSGTMTLTGPNTYTGKTIIKATGGGGPKLSVSSLNSVTSPAQQASSSLGVPADAAAGTIDLGSTGNTRSCTLIYTGAGETTDRVMNVSFNSNANQTIQNSGGGLLKFTSTFTINPSSGNTSRALYLRGAADGEIAGGLGATPLPGSLRKSDAGTWTIGGTNLANAVIVEDTGTLVVNGTLTADSATAPTISVNETSTLAGSGTVTGDVTVAAGASLTPGASVGTLDIDGALDISALAGGGGLLNFELDAIAASDEIAVTGALAIGTELLGLSDFTFADLGGLENGIYTLISSTGLTGSVDPADKDGTLGLATIELQTSGNNVVLAVSGLAGGGGPTDADDAVSITGFASSIGFDPTGGTGGTIGAASGSFAGYTGGSYSVEWSPDLSVTAFTTVFGPVPGAGTSGTAGVAIPWSYDTNDTEGYFRLVITP